MRTRWVTGSATGVEGNYEGRYITPWREDPNVLTADDVGIDNSLDYPLDKMTTRQFVAATWRVYSWEVTWNIGFSGPAYSQSSGGIFTVLPYATFPVEGEDDLILPTEEHRLGAGFSLLHEEDVEIAYPGALSTVQCQMGGIHQYILPGDDVQQRFRMYVRFAYSLDLAPNEPGTEVGTWSLLANRTPTQSVGQSILTMDYAESSFTDGQFPSYASEQGVLFAGVGNNTLIGPATITGSVIIRPKRWYEHAKADGTLPIFDLMDGHQLRSARAQPSTEPVGQVIADLSGTRFVA